MANIETEDLGDLDWDNFGDDGFGDFDSEPPKDDRNPATKILGGFVEGVKADILNPSTQHRFIRGVLPEGYKHALDTADSAFSSVNELLDEARKGAKPVIRDLKRGTRLILPKVESVLPKSYAEKLKNWSKEEDLSTRAKSLTAEEVEANAIAVELGGVFNAHMEAQKKREQQRDTEQQLKDITQIRQASSLQELMRDVSDSSRRLVEYQDQVTANYQRKSLELQYKHYFVSRKLLNTMEKHLGITEAGLTNINKNVALPDIVKYKSHEKMLDMLKSQMFGRVTEPMGQWYRGIGQRVVKKAKGEINQFFSDIGTHINDAVTGAQEMQESLASGEEMIRDMGGEDAVRDMRLNMGGNALGGMASTWLIDKLIDPVKRKIEENGMVGASDYALLRKIANAPGRIRDFANSESDLPDDFDFLGRGKEWLKYAVGNNQIETMVQKSGVDQLDQQAYLKNKTIRTLEEVIPGWLSKIHQQVKITASGDKNAEQEMFNFETSQFEGVSKIKENIKERLVGKRSKNELKIYADNVMKQIDPSGTALSPDAATALRTYLIKLAYNRKSFNPDLLVNEYKFPSEIPSRFKSEIIALMRQQYSFRDDVEYDDDNNFKGDPFKMETDVQKKLLRLTNSFNSLTNNFPDAMDKALKEARMDRIGLLEQDGFVKRGADGTTYNLDRDKLLEMLMSETPAAPPAPAGGKGKGKKGKAKLNLGGLFDAPAFGRSEGGQVDAPGSGANDTANAELANREYVINARSTALPGVLPLARYLNSLGNMGTNPAGISGEATEDGLNSGSYIENAINRFHEEAITRADRMFDLVTTISEKMDNLMSLSLNLGGVGDSISNVGNRVREGMDSLGQGAQNVASAAGGAARGLGAKLNLNMNSINLKGISEELNRKLESLEVESLFEDGIPDPEKVRDFFKDKLTELELKELMSSYNKRRKEILKGLESRAERASGAVGDAAGRAVGKIPSILKWLRKSGKKNTDRALDLIFNAKRMGTEQVGKAYDRFKDKLADVWVEGEDKPRIRADLLRSGAYIDANTGKIINSFADITGEVRDKSGNVVLSFDEFRNKLVDPYGKTVLEYLTKKAKQAQGLAMKPVEFIRNRFKNLGNTLQNVIDGPADVYVKGEMDKPRLYARLMEAGVYRNKATGSVIQRPSDIKGEVEEVDGQNIKIVLTLEDIKKGLVDVNGEAFKSIPQIGRLLAKKALAVGMVYGKRVLDVAKLGFNKLVGMLKTGGGRLKGFAGSLSDSLNISLFASTRDVVDRLDKIYELLEKCKCGAGVSKASEDEEEQSTNPEDLAEKGKRNVKGARDKMRGKRKAKSSNTGSTAPAAAAGDADGDGDRDNSAQDRRQRSQEESERNEERSRWRQLIDGMKNKGRNATDAAQSGIMSLIGKITPLLAGATTLLSTVAKSMGTVGSWVMKLGGLVGRGALSLGSAAIKGVGMLGRGVLGLGKLAVRAAPMILRGAATVLTGPVGLAVTAGYIGYKLYKYYTRENTPLTKFRFAQYGYKADDQDHVAKLITLEQECLKIVKVAPNQVAKLGSGKTLGELTKIFGVDPNNQTDMEKWIAWFQHRFKPVFLGSITELFRLTGKTNLGDIDKSLYTKQKRDFIRNVNTMQVELNPYKMTTSPFAGEDEVTLKPADVQEAYENAMDEIDDNESRNDSSVDNAAGVKPKESKSWWQSLKESGAGAAAGLSALTTKAMEKANSLAKSALNAGGRAVDAAGSAITSGVKTVGGIVAAGADAAASAASNVYSGAVDAASAGMENVAKAFEVRSSLKGPRKDNFMSVYRAAEQAGDPHPAIVAAQWALESGWGKKESGKFNYFGIKARKGEPGTVRRTREVRNGRDVMEDHKFTDYPSLEAGIQGRVNFINENARYRKAGYYSAKTPYEAALALVRGQYATDPKYATLLGKIMAGMGIDPSKPSGTGSKPGGAAPVASPPVTKTASNVPKTAPNAANTASNVPNSGKAFVPYANAAASEPTGKPLQSLATSEYTPPEYKPQKVSFSPPSKESKAAKQAAADSAVLAKEKQRDMEINMEMGRIAQQQLKAAVRAADTLENIHEVLKRIESLGGSKQAQPANIPNANKPAPQPDRKAPVDISRTY